jgi:hypothetical protein
MMSVVFGVGSGYTTTGEMIKWGFIVLVPAILIALFIGFPLASALLA